MKKVLSLFLLVVSFTGLVSCGTKKEKETIDYKNDTLEALIEKAGIHQESPSGYLDTYKKNYANSYFYSISRNSGNDYYIWSETKVEQYYCYSLTLKYEPAEDERIVLHYSWIDESYQEKPDKTKVIYCSGTSNDVNITVQPYGMISLWTVNVKEIVVNYSNKTFADEKFTIIEKYDDSKEVDPRIGIYEGIIESMLTSFDSFLEANNLALFF